MSRRIITIDVAAPDDLPWIAELELQNYGGFRAVALARLEEWYAANPRGFLVIRAGGERSGHATLLPLRPPILQSLADGTKSENDISGADLFGPSERSSVRGIYLESVIAYPLDLFGELVRMLPEHITALADPELVEDLYVAPMTAGGQLIVKNLGFEPVGPSLYVTNLKTLAQRTASLRQRLAGV